jgi:transposase-like protein
MERPMYGATAGRVTGSMKPISKFAVWCWVESFRRKLRLTRERRRRRIIAVDEAVLEGRGHRLRVWTAVDAETGEAIRLEASRHRSAPLGPPLNQGL